VSELRYLGLATIPNPIALGLATTLTQAPIPDPSTMGLATTPDPRC